MPAFQPKLNAADLEVSRPAFDQGFAALVANFGTLNDATTLRPIKALYERLVFIPDGLAVAGDAVWQEAIGDLIRTRTERGMPRVAEIRERLTRILERDALYRLQEQTRETLRTLEAAVQEDRPGRQELLDRTADAVARILGDIQTRRAQERERQNEQQQRIVDDFLDDFHGR